MANPPSPQGLVTTRSGFTTLRLAARNLLEYPQRMEEHVLAAFFDEFRKIAVAGGQLSQSSMPKTPAPTPVPAAKLAPMKSALAPKVAPVKPLTGATGGLSNIRNPGLRAQVASSRQLRGLKPPPPRNQDTLKPRNVPAPNIRAVTTMPVRRPSKPAFLPGNEGMGRYTKPLSSADLGI